MKKKTGDVAGMVKFRDAVRVAKFEVVKPICDDPKLTWARWHDLGRAMQEMTNCIWRRWLVWHLEQGTPEKLRAWLRDVTAWHKADPVARGEKPKCDANAVTKELSAAIYQELTALYPEVNARPRVLLMNAVTSKITARKAAQGNLPGWMAILLCRESIPSARREQPIPFDKKCAEFLAVEDGYRLRLRIDRIERPGTTAKSTLSELILKTKHRKAAGQVAILKAILAGEYAFCGSSLCWDDRNRKWFVHVAFKRPIEVQAEGKHTAVLRPGYYRPWSLLFGGRVYFRMFGDGSDVAYQRRNLLAQRWGRQEKYRYAGSASKGHGRNRTLGPFFKLEQNWRNYVTTRNHTSTGQLVRFCLERGIGTLIYVQPADEFGPTRYLAKVGKHPERRDSTAWDWHQVASMLGYKCKDAGIHLIVKKHDRRERPSKKDEEAA